MKIGIFHTAFIGDIVLCGLLIEALHHAGHEIVFFTKPHLTPIYNDDLRIQKVVHIKKQAGLRKILAIQTIANQIRSEKCDVLIVPHRSATSSLCAKLSRVPVTIGFENAVLSFLYKITVPFSQNKHECVRYLALASEGLIQHEEISQYEKIGRPFLRYKESAFENFNQKFKNLDILQKDFFIIAPGSVWATKKYPIASWVDVAVECLTKNPNFYCALCGGTSDKKDILEFMELLKNKAQNLNLKDDISKRVVNTCEMFSLSEFAIFISRAKCVLSNDSSPTHFASAFNIPVVTVFGPTVPAFGFGPTSEKRTALVFIDEKGNKLFCQPCSIHGQKKCPLGHHRCMKDLKPETVANAIDGILI